MRGSADGHWAMGVVYDVITDTAQHSASDKPGSPRSHDDEIDVLLCCHANNHVTWLQSIVQARSYLGSLKNLFDHFC